MWSTSRLFRRPDLDQCHWPIYHITFNLETNNSINKVQVRKLLLSYVDIKYSIYKYLKDIQGMSKDAIIYGFSGSLKKTFQIWIQR